MHRIILTTVLLTATTGIGRAQDASPSDPVTNTAPLAEPVTNTAPLADPVTNTVPWASPINHAGAIGLGPILGEPMGLTAKFWLSERFAFDAGAAWSFVDPDGFQLYGDFLFHKFDLFHPSRGELPLYFGIGGRGKFVENADDRAGIRFPVGVAYLLPNEHLEFFAEIVPVLDLAPSTRLAWNGGVGIRYYFR